MEPFKSAYDCGKCPINVSTLSELLRGHECVVWQCFKSGAGRIERFEGRRWCGRGRMLAMGFLIPFGWAGPGSEGPASVRNPLCSCTQSDRKAMRNEDRRGCKAPFSGLRHTSGKHAAKHTMIALGAAARKSQADMPPFVPRRRSVRPRVVRQGACIRDSAGTPIVWALR
jgi:hypothetical protein